MDFHVTYCKVSLREDKNKTGEEKTMHREIKINYDSLEELTGKIQTYQSALARMKESVARIFEILEGCSGEAYEALLKRKDTIVQQMASCEEELQTEEEAYGCEAMWARMKEELLYGRYNTKKMTIEELKTLIWRYFIVYWNTRRICSANGGLPPMFKRKQYYEALEQAA